MRKEVVVEGMKCEGCANAVYERFTAVEGVEAVKVDLANKKVTLESQTDIDTANLNAALSNTKYSIVEQ